MHPGAAIFVAYLAGSFPTAWLAGRWKGVDLRSQGSGNLGATNVMRVLGPGIGALVFGIDIAKGSLPVLLLAPRIDAPAEMRAVWAIACGLAAIVGHIRPVFLGFGKGGKGVATACGVFLALAPLHTALTLLIFVAVVLASGFVSLASLTAAVALPVLLAVGLGVHSPLLYVSLLTMVFVFWTHRANIQRLRAGTEYRFGRAAKLGRRPSLAIGIALLVLAAVVVAARVG